MHTDRVIDEDGREWVVIHNGDWSGDAILRRFAENGSGRIEDEKMLEEHVIPGIVLRKIAALGVVGDVIAMLEQWDGSSHAAMAAMSLLAGAARAKKKSEQRKT
jgi:hypothetical protein